MFVWKFLFWFSCLAVFYNYAGYALLLVMLNAFKKKKKTLAGQELPSVSFIVAAFNEQDFIEKKIQNSLALDYPADRIEFIFITDGSSDATMDIIRNYSSIQLLHRPERKGKTAALNRAVGYARNEILIFSDANTMLNAEAVANIARHYHDPETGGVAGEKKVISASQNDEVGAGEGLYWKYESFLKQLDSDFYSVVGAAGELFSLRKSLFEPIDPTVILDDFLISMKVALKGYRVVYEPQAYAMELPSFSIEDEQKRKVRIAAGGFQAMKMLGSLFHFWKHGRLSFLYISHRVLRWTLSPLCLLMAFISNAVLLLMQAAPLYLLTFAVQILFYAMAVTASLYTSTGSWFKPVKLAYYFVFMNISVVHGFLRFLKGKQSSVWEKAKRGQAAVHLK